MPPIPRRDYSVPRPAGFVVDTSKRVPFPTIKRVALAIHIVARKFFPTHDSFPVETSATPREAQRRPLPPQGQRVPYVNPKWPVLPPVRGNTTIMATPGVKDK